MRLTIWLAITVLAVGLVFVMGVHYEMVRDRYWTYPTVE